MSRNRRQVRNYLLNPRFQIRYILLSVVAGLLITAANAAVFYYFTRENYAILVDLAPMSQEVKNQLYTELGQIILFLVGFSALFVLAIALIGLILSHRAAGPLYHFKRVFESIRAGDTQGRIHLRPGDDFQEVASSFNAMMDSLAQKSDTEETRQK